MGNLNIEINIGESRIALNGDSTVVCDLFKDLRNQGLGMLDIEKKEPCLEITNEVGMEKVTEVSTDKGSQTKPNKKNTKTNKKTPPLDTSLDLSGKGASDSLSLKDFLLTKASKNNLQRTTLYVYYLDHFLNKKEITESQVFTCYRQMGDKIPKNLKQNLTDCCSSKYGYLMIENGNYSLTSIGLNKVEHDWLQE